MRHLSAILLAALLLGGCRLAPYRPPGPGEPAALVKVRLAYDHAQARAAIPAAGHDRFARVSVILLEGDRASVLAVQQLPDLLASPEPAPLETLAVTLHADRPVTLRVGFAAVWSVTTSEWVSKPEQVSRQVTRQVPRQVARTESYYDSMSRSTRTRTVYVTEHVSETVTEQVTEHRSVWEPVTRQHEAGCEAAAALRPVAGGVYLLDYANLALAEQCSLAAFRQAPRPDGTFSLTPLQADGRGAP